MAESDPKTEAQNESEHPWLDEEQRIDFDDLTKDAEQIEAPPEAPHTVNDEVLEDAKNRVFELRAGN